MTRFWAFLFFAAIAVSSTVPADETTCGNEDQATSSRATEGVILRSLMRTSESIETRTETAPTGVFLRRLPTVSQHSYPVERKPAEVPIKVRRDSLVIRTRATAFDQEPPSVALSFREPAGAQDPEESSVRQVRFDLEDLREELDKANDGSPLDFSELRVAQPPRPLGGSDPNRAETEATLDLLRREMRREAERKRPLKTLPRQTNTPQPPQPQPEDEPRTPAKAEPLIPLSPGQANIIPDADGPLSENIDDVDDENDNQDGRKMEAEESPWPEMAPEPRQQMDTWITDSWTLNMLKDDDGADACEPVFCEQMWACAGGRHQSWFQRAMHNLHRNFDVVAVGRCGRCGSYGRGERTTGTRSLCGSAIGSCCHVGVGRTQRGRRSAARNRGCVGDCASPGTCTDCTSQSDCTAAADCGTGGCGLCSTCLGEYLCRGCRLGADREPWAAWGLLFGDVEPGINVFGWASTGYHSRANALFNNHPHGLNTHQAWVAFERVADTTCKDFAWGVRADVMYGLDAQDTQAFGSHPSSYDYRNGLDHGDYGWAIPQLYGELAFGETSFIIGHFYTLMGYEVVPAPDNFFFSHSITMYNSEPFTHTGVLATTATSEYLEWYYGWTLGWDTGFDQLNNGNSFLGGFKLRLTDALSATYITSAGDFGERGSGYAQSLVFAANISEKWGYVLQSDLLRIHGEDNVGANQYVFYELNDCISLGTRFEWWKGDNVTAYAPFGAVLPAGGSHSYYETTMGANFHVGTNVVIRPEGRYDWSPAVNYSVGTGAVDVVFTF